MGKKSRQDVFVEEYLIDLNATQAAIRAGYSPKTANEQGSRLLANVSIQNKIGKAMAERSKRTGVNQDRVIQELARVAFVNPKNVINTKTGEILPEATEDDLACIQSVKIKKTATARSTTIEREVKMADKMRALELLGKHLGMYKDKIEQQLDMDLNITIDYGEGAADEH